MIPLLPILSILTRGLMGIGAMMAFAVLLFLARFIRAKLKTIIIGMIVGYISLSFYVTYMRDRPQLRGVIWSRAPAMDRIMALQKTFFEPEWFNPFNFTHLATVDERINQNILVGMAVEHLKTGSIDYARGYTIYESVLALFPRILWPEKNVYAGSGDIVSKYTGLTFYGATSVGVGEVMEFYINFGRTGVMIGFLIIGILIKMADLLCGYALLKEDSMVFILWFLVGISLSGGVGGSLVEVTASCGASIVVAHLVAQIKVKYYYYLLFSFVLYIILRFIFLSI